MQPFFAYSSFAQGQDGSDADAPPPSPTPGTVRTMMVGEAPGEDIGYDPESIPTEPIPDEDDEPN
jgi:hypothetical protein